MKKKHKKKKRKNSPPPSQLSEQEMGLYGAPGTAPPPDTGKVKVGDIISVVVRAKVCQVGGEMVQLELVELYSNNIVNHPVFVWAPAEHIRSSQLPSDPMPGSDPAWKVSHADS